MTLEEMKIKILGMMEELNSENVNLTDDPDIATKINGTINQIQNELARIKKIPTKHIYDTTLGLTLDLTTIPNFYQLLKIANAEFDITGNEVTFKEAGLYTIYYYKYPTRITEENESDYTFEISNDLLEIMPYGVAGDMLKSDISANYGKIYSDRYAELKQSIDPRTSEGFLFIKENI